MIPPHIIYLVLLLYQSNIIVSGTAIEDELWWNDELDEDGVLGCYVERCCITLVDFGFAR